MVGETFEAFLNRLNKWFRCWRQLEHREETYEDLLAMIIQEQYFSGIPASITTFIRTQKVTDTERIVELSQDFVNARPGFDKRSGDKEG